MEKAGETLRKLSDRLRVMAAIVRHGKPENICITSIDPPRKRARCWVNGYIGEYSFEALLYPQHARRPETEILHSHIAKLCIRRIADRRIMAAFERGWELHPTTRRVGRMVRQLAAGLYVRVYGGISETPTTKRRCNPISISAIPLSSDAPAAMQTATATAATPQDGSSTQPKMK